MGKEVETLDLSLLERQLANGWADVEERDKAFSVEYLTNGFNHCNAAESVGLSRSSGMRKLRNPLVSAFISYLQEQNSSAKLITQQFVEAQYLEILPKLKGDEDVDMVDLKTGESFRARKFHSAEIVSVLRDLGKSSGYIAPDVGVGGSGPTVNVQINLADLSGE